MEIGQTDVSSRDDENPATPKKAPRWLWALLLGCILVVSPVISHGAGRETSRLDHRLEALGFIKLQKDPDAPEFTLQDTSGKSVRFADHRGKVVFLTFWTTW